MGSWPRWFALRPLLPLPRKSCLPGSLPSDLMDLRAGVSLLVLLFPAFKIVGDANMNDLPAPPEVVLVCVARLLLGHAALLSQPFRDGGPNETVRHSQNEWVVGDVHTNGIEGVWASSSDPSWAFSTRSPQSI